MSESFPIHWGYYPEAHWALAVLGVEAMSEESARSLNPHFIGHDHRFRIAVHEAGHCIMSLSQSVDFDFVEVDYAQGSGVLSFDLATSATASDTAPFSERVAVDLAGMLAEEFLFGSAFANGAAIDASRVLARFEIHMAAVDHRRVREARAHTQRVRQILREYREMLFTLAVNLQSDGRLTRDRCVDLLQQHHRHYFCPAAFRWLAPSEEQARVCEADARVKARQDELRLEGGLT